eukprot:4509049-Pleurochrysis_carterae.AAC.1
MGRRGLGLAAWAPSAVARWGAADAATAERRGALAALSRSDRAGRESWWREGRRALATQLLPVARAVLEEAAAWA